MNGVKIESLGRTNQIEREIKIMATLLLGFLIYFYLTDMFYRMIDLPKDLIETAKEIMAYLAWLLSGLVIDSFNYFLQFLFLNFCIQICFQFAQIEDDLQEFKYIYDERQVNEMLQEVVKTHLDILDMISTLMEEFGYIICLNFIMNIWFIGQCLMFSYNSDWYNLTLVTPFMLFDAWIYCYGSQLIISKVDCF